MSNLGNLYFDIQLRDMTDADIDKIKKKLEKVGVKMGVDVDRKTFETNIKEALKNKTFKVNVEANKNIKKAAIEANKSVLGRSVTDFLRDNTFKANVELVVKKASVQQAIREAFAQAGLRYDTTSSDARQNLIDTRTAKTNAYVEAQRALAELRRAQAASAQAANQQADAMERVNRAGERQKGVMATIREQVANAYALYRVGRFLEGVIRISGEFQQQHVALQTILGDAQKADVLFARIKNLAVESPFKFGDLTGYAKQLAAFSIPYEELFDTLKRFGDLSAGLGVDMGRIILAYGQVRSAEFLKGTELRQFTEAGIPLVTELARRYTELEGTLVSVGEVYDRISKKQVAFSDVKAVLWDLTSEGGRFFNMQAELTDTLKGKLDKLIDSYEIFLANLGESNNDVLGGTLDMLTDVLNHWREVGNAILGVVTAYGSYKAAMLLVAAVQKATIAIETIQGIMNLTRAMQGLTAATKAQAVAQGILNTITSANPFVLAATILGSIAGLFIAFREETESEADAMTRLHESMQMANEEAEKTKSNADDLISVMKNEKNSIDIRNKAYDDLLEIYGLLFPNMTREQVLLMDEAKLRERVARAAREERKEKAKAKLNSYESQLLEAQKKRTELNFVPIRYRDSNWDEKVKNADDFIASLVVLRDEARMLYNDIDKEDKKFLELTKQRWYTESKKIAEEAGLSALIPTDKETDVWEYFDRIKQGMDDIKNKKSMLDPKSANYSTMLGNLDDELKAYEKIYYGVLGGKNEEALKAAEQARKERERKAAEEAKLNKKLGEEAAKAYAEGVKAEMSRIASQWDLYKQLFEATGDKAFAMTAFNVTPVWDEAAEQMKKQLEDAMSEKGIEDALEFDIPENLGKVLYGDFYDSWKEIKDRIEKNGIDLKVNTANAIKETQTVEGKIKAAENKRDEELSKYTEGSAEYNAVAKKWEQEIAKLQGELFELSPAFKKLFVDTAGMASSKLYGMWKQAKNLVELIKNNTSKEVENADGKVIGRYFTNTKGGTDYIAEETFEKLMDRLPALENEVGKTQIAFNRLWDSVEGNGSEGYNLSMLTKDLSVAVEYASKLAVEVSGALKSMGFESASDTTNSISVFLGGLSKMAEATAAFAAGDNVSGFESLASGINQVASSVASIKESREDRDITRLRGEVKALANEYANLNKELERQLGGATSKQTDAMIQSLEDQKAKLQELVAEEEEVRAKDRDDAKIQDYKQEITEIEEQLKYFYEDLASEQYGIDIKEWAGQIADALTEAFASGQDAAEAFDKSVSDILRSLATEAIKLQFIEPAMANLREYMFGEGGIFMKGSESDSALSANEAVGLKNELDKLKEQIAASNDYWDAINEAVGGMLDSTEKSASGLSKGIQGVTEDTADILASYLNATRADVAVNRTLIEQLVNVSVPRMSVLAEAQLQQLQMIVNNTSKNVALVGEIRDLVNTVVDKGGRKLKV